MTCRGLRCWPWAAPGRHSCPPPASPRPTLLQPRCAGAAAAGAAAVFCLIDLGAEPGACCCRLGLQAEAMEAWQEAHERRTGRRPSTPPLESSVRAARAAREALGAGGAGQEGSCWGMTSPACLPVRARLLAGQTDAWGRRATRPALARVGAGPARAHLLRLPRTRECCCATLSSALALAPPLQARPNRWSTQRARPGRSAAAAACAALPPRSSRAQWPRAMKTTHTSLGTTSERPCLLFRACPAPSAARTLLPQRRALGAGVASSAQTACCASGFACRG